MIFEETPVAGAFLVYPERHVDKRGWFARTWCTLEFEERGLTSSLAQCSVSQNRLRGTLRGLHYQAPPHEEDKLVRCQRGSIYDVVLDLRPGSPTYLVHHGVELTEASQQSLYVPKGCAHGFQTLEDDTLVFYQMSTPYQPGADRGVRWDDPAFGIAWPIPEPILLPRDAAYPDYEAVRE